MPRIKQEINPKSRKNLKQLCDELHITQKQLAEASGISENTLSKIATGRSPLTRQVAEEIIKVCHTYRIEWLLGFDDVPHENVMLNIPSLETAKRCLAVVKLLCTLGVSVGQVNDAGLFLPATQTGGFLFADKAVEIRRGEAVIWSGDMRKIECILPEICDFALFKIELLQREWRSDNG